MHLPDTTLRHLQQVANLPDLAGTRYEMVEPLGRGGMGAVYRVTNRALGRDVALKVLNGATDAASLARLETEARILAHLEHPGIVPVHDVGTLPDGRLFYVMKLVRGQRLDAWANHAGAVSERVRLLVRVADAVAFAHARGIVHRDLTPANIIGAFGEVLVMDWGLALSNQTQPDPTSVNPTQPGSTRPNLPNPVVAGTAGLFRGDGNCSLKTCHSSGPRQFFFVLFRVTSWIVFWSGIGNDPRSHTKRHEIELLSRSGWVVRGVDSTWGTGV